MCDLRPPENTSPHAGADAEQALALAILVGTAHAPSPPDDVLEQFILIMDFEDIVTGIAGSRDAECALPRIAVHPANRVDDIAIIQDEREIPRESIPLQHCSF